MRNSLMTPSERDAADDCTDCTLHDRRSFLAKTLAAIAAATVLLPGVVKAEELTGFVMYTATRRADGTAKYPVPAADGATIDTENEVILVRSGGKCMAFALSCPHQRAMLKIKGGDTAFLCPKHKSEYRIDGEYIRGRATRSMDRRAIRKDGAELVVDIESQIKSDADAAGWTAAVVNV
jgi:nitrite reductase/ring-hydroxylating ferredoxin subunit